jgi:hypothetical protein
VKSLEKYLNDLESRIIVHQEQKLVDNWTAFSKGEWTENTFHPQRSEFIPPSLEWPDININDALASNEVMVLDQFHNVSKQISSKDGKLLVVRSNYGVGIFPSLYGAEKFIMPREMNCLPNVRSLKGGEKALQERLLDSPTPDFSNGFGDDVFKTGEMYSQIFKAYPNIARFVAVDHPDCQGPVDILELLWGSDMFLGLYDRPDFTHELLTSISETYEKFISKWYEVCPQEKDMHVTWGNGFQGKICLRDDSAMNLSPDMYKQFIYPYNERLLKYFGGGSIHSCGRVDHFAPYLSEMEGLTAFNMSQPDYNDMEEVYKNTVDKGIPIFGMNGDEAVRAVESGRNLSGLLQY